MRQTNQPARSLAMLCGVAAGAALMAGLPWSSALAGTVGDGIVRVKSAYGVTETVERIKADIAAKGIMFFAETDQARLAADAGVSTRPSTLLQFGNPPLGTQFITANPNAGLDWPVRLLVNQDEAGAVWTVYTDFRWIAQRHQIKTRGPQFDKAAEVIASITASIAAK